jgi:hypothetical protein
VFESSSVGGPDPFARLGKWEQAFWSLTLYPDAGEAGGCFVSARRSPHGTGVRGQALDADRSRAEAGRRARGRLRRYCAANRLNHLGTLTYAGEGNFDPRLARVHVGEFFRGLRTQLGGQSVPYVWVPEWHETHGLHLHFALPRFVRWQLIKRVWGRGGIDIKLIGDLPIGSGTLQEARIAGGYLAKYVAKTFGDHEHLAGLHRYEVAQGFQPSRERLVATSLDGLLDSVNARMGGTPARSWFSRDQEGWEGPPAMWFQWA